MGMTFTEFKQRNDVGYLKELGLFPMPAVRERVENAIVDLIDMEMWEHSQKTERAEIETITNTLEKWSDALKRE